MYICIGGCFDDKQCGPVPGCYARYNCLQISPVSNLKSEFSRYENRDIVLIISRCSRKILSRANEGFGRLLYVQCTLTLLLLENNTN